MALEDISLSDLLQCLVECSQKAARIAQIFREENDLFQLLVEEKSEKEKNKRFVQDFKTLADVLVQETIRRDVGRQFPSLASTIQGEEQNSFQNSLGESIRVELTDLEDDTMHLLDKVLDGRSHVAKALAAVVHSNTTCERQHSCHIHVPAHSLGVWIDPIDSTAEYIQAKSDDTGDDHGIQLYGLKCVCVLIGAYDLQSGAPVLGVVNQPFFQKNRDDSRWESQFYWAINFKQEQATSASLKSIATQNKNIIVLSSSESKELKDIIATKYKIVYTAGAGYKSLLVAKQKADLYVLSQGTTYYWDTCGPHALLTAQGGGIVEFNDALIMDTELMLKKQVRYSSNDTDTKAFRNANGIIAYRNPEVLLDFVQLLKEKGFCSCK